MFLVTYTDKSAEKRMAVPQGFEPWSKALETSTLTTVLWD